MAVDPAELLRIDRAEVYKAGRLAAELRRLSDRTEFVYRAEYVNENHLPVATTLPIKGDSVWSQAGAVPPFFAGLLPEGRRLRALQRRVKTSADDEFTLLLAVGGDLVGDVQVVPSGVDPSAVEPLAVVDGGWEAVDFFELFNQSIGARPDASGIAGIQEKVSDRMIVVPSAQKRGRYILKLNPPEFPNLVENEAFFLSAASGAGLRTNEFQVVSDRNGLKGLLVYRFDRATAADGSIGSVAQEDGLQVLGRYPADKYAISTESLIRALAEVTTAPVVAAFEMLRTVIFSYLIGNGDLHAKNLSVYAPKRDTWIVTPAYDIASTYLYDDHTMALSIGQHDRPTDITRSEMLGLANETSVSERAAARLIDEQLEASDEWLRNSEQLPSDERKLHKFRRFVENRKKLLAGNPH